MTFIEESEALRPDIDRPLQIGEVQLVNEEQRLDSLGRPYFYREVVVGDESDDDPEKRKSRFRKLALAERQLEEHPEWTPTVLVNGELIVDPRNEPAMELYYENGRPTQMVSWGTQMMQAVALEPIQRLSRGGQFLPEGSSDPRTVERFTYEPDGIGIRSRQHIYSNLLVEHARSTGSDTLRIASLGSGAAVPNIEASERIENEVGKRVEWQLFDSDPRALRYAQTFIGQSNVAHSTFDYGPRNNQGFTGRRYAEAKYIPDESLDAVDALGLWEYLRPNTAASFLKMLYPKLKSGSPMIVSNMRASRPSPLYNSSSIGWPALHMRDDEELLGIVAKAGIDTENVTFTHAQDGVYVVMEIRKP